MKTTTSYADRLMDVILSARNILTISRAATTKGATKRSRGVAIRKIKAVVAEMKAATDRLLTGDYAPGAPEDVEELHGASEDWITGCSGIFDGVSQGGAEWVDRFGQAIRAFELLHAINEGLDGYLAMRAALEADNASLLGADTEAAATETPITRLCNAATTARVAMLNAGGNGGQTTQQRIQRACGALSDLDEQRQVVFAALSADSPQLCIHVQPLIDDMYEAHSDLCDFLTTHWVQGQPYDHKPSYVFRMVVCLTTQGALWDVRGMGPDGNGQKPLRVVRQHPDYDFGIDCRSVRWYGTTYSFTSAQAGAVKMLAEAFERKVPDVRIVTLLESAGVSEKSKLKDTFRRCPAWGTMIVPGKTKGTHQLVKPKDT